MLCCMVRSVVCGPVLKSLINLPQSVPNVLLLEAHAGAHQVAFLAVTLRATVITGQREL